MAVFRVEKTKDFTVMSNHHLRNAKLSLKAKGFSPSCCRRRRIGIIPLRGWPVSARTVWIPLPLL